MRCTRIPISKHKRELTTARSPSRLHVADGEAWFPPSKNGAELPGPAPFSFLGRPVAKSWQPPNFTWLGLNLVTAIRRACACPVKRAQHAPHECLGYPTRCGTLNFAPTAARDLCQAGHPARKIVVSPAARRAWCISVCCEQTLIASTLGAVRPSGSVSSLHGYAGISSDLLYNVYLLSKNLLHLTAYNRLRPVGSVVKRATGFRLRYSAMQQLPAWHRQTLVCSRHDQGIKDAPANGWCFRS